jgi:hypothetical protein
VKTAQSPLARTTSPPPIHPRSARLLRRKAKTRDAINPSPEQRMPPPEHTAAAQPLSRHFKDAQTSPGRPRLENLDVRGSYRRPCDSGAALVLCGANRCIAAGLLNFCRDACEFWLRNRRELLEAGARSMRDSCGLSSRNNFPRRGNSLAQDQQSLPSGWPRSLRRRAEPHDQESSEPNRAVA